MNSEGFMDCHSREWAELFPFRFILRKCIGASALICLLFTGCAVVGVNNYQTAETLGKGKFKVGLAFEYGRKMDAGILAFDGDITILNGLDSEDFIYPILEVSGQYGITPSTDIGITVTQAFLGTSGSKALHIKQGLVHTPGNFAIAVVPGAGLFGSDRESSGSYGNIRFEGKDEFQGYLFELPVIISKRWKYFAIHMAPKYMFHYLKVKTDYKEFRTSDGVMESHDWAEKTFDFNTIGMAVGLTLVHKNVQFTPEVSFLRVEDLTQDSFRWSAFPGLGFSVKF